MNEHLRWLIVPAIVVSSTASTAAYAVQYLTVDEAQHVLFPQSTQFASRPVTLTEAQRQKVEELSRVKLRFLQQPVWQAMAGDSPQGWFVVDAVYGKHEFITYAVALDSTGAVLGVEILEYRETHGGEIRDPRWRAQFTGVRPGAPLVLNKDIQNISGATLSCKHLTEGVRRVLAIFDLALR